MPARLPAPGAGGSNDTGMAARRSPPLSVLQESFHLIRCCESLLDAQTCGVRRRGPNPCSTAHALQDKAGVKSKILDTCSRNDRDGLTESINDERALQRRSRTILASVCLSAP